jgi:hypothetical protein
MYTLQAEMERAQRIKLTLKLIHYNGLSDVKVCVFNEEPAI